MKVGDKVKVMSRDNYFITMGFKERYGKIHHINKHLITVQFKNYKESFRVADILCKGWIDMELWKERNWIKVNKEVMK